jgi:small-conductance mechanosensitive channel
MQYISAITLTRLSAFILGGFSSYAWHSLKHEVLYIGLTHDDQFAGVLLGILATTACSLSVPIWCVIASYSKECINFFLIFLFMVGFIVGMSVIIINHGFILPGVLYLTGSLSMLLVLYQLTTILERLITKQHRP